jgi:hypothetical protein
MSLPHQFVVQCQQKYKNPINTLPNQQHTPTLSVQSSSQNTNYSPPSFQTNPLSSSSISSTSSSNLGTSGIPMFSPLVPNQHLTSPIPQTFPVQQTQHAQPSQIQQQSQSQQQQSQLQQQQLQQLQQQQLQQAEQLQFQQQQLQQNYQKIQNQQEVPDLLLLNPNPQPSNSFFSSQQQTQPIINNSSFQLTSGSAIIARLYLFIIYIIYFLLIYSSLSCSSFKTSSRS